ncbi:MAG: methionine biosynthesis protein MetW [Planctomycetota bacterium]|nr:methionine biosynthesis protein MetW [Planctomycetota bacterium]
MTARKTKSSSDLKYLRLLEKLRDEVDPALRDCGAARALDFFASVGAASRPILGADGRALRWQNEIILAHIPARATVLDLGCGDGELLAELMRKKQVQGQGVELCPASVGECVRRGVPVVQMDVDAGLRNIPDGSFDYVVLEETLQTLQHPDVILREMLRVGRCGIVSFPNFAYWQVRLDLAIRGRMPRTGWLPYTWYNTPNIHNLSVQDFRCWAQEKKIAVKAGYVLSQGKVRAMQDGDNLYAEEAMFVVERRQISPPKRAAAKRRNGNEKITGKKIGGGE